MEPCSAFAWPCVRPEAVALGVWGRKPWAAMRAYMHQGTQCALPQVGCARGGPHISLLQGFKLCLVANFKTLFFVRLYSCELPRFIWPTRAGLR